MRLPALVGAIAITVAPAVFAAADDSAEWLVKMSNAAHAATYDGVVLYRSNRMLDTFHVIHRNQNGNEVERVQSLNGEMSDILKTGNKLICLLPRDRRLTINPPTPKGMFPGLTLDKVREFSQIYMLDDLGKARVAGRVCRGIAITPRDQYRYGYEVWADDQTAVPLKVNLIGRDGSMLEQMMFTEVSFPATIPDSAFQMPPADKDQKRITRNLPPPNMATTVATAPPTESVDWTLSHLPPGFKVTMRDVRVLPNNGGTVEHLMVSDGLSAISIFSAQHPHADKPLNGMSEIGAVSAYGRMIGSFHITVVGEAPPQTVRMIGDGLQQADANPVVATPVAAPVAAEIASPAPAPAPVHAPAP
ncbi:MAG: MucB/RseB C-terminal domain-containing protein [Stenotrophobium sp.]